MGVCKNCGSRTYMDRRMQKEICLICDRKAKKKKDLNEASPELD